MSSLVEKVAQAIADDNLLPRDEAAKAAIATVLREMTGWSAYGRTINLNDARAIDTMLRAFAAEHSIEME